MSESVPLPPAKRGCVPWLIGAFALWQIVSSVLTNVFEFIPRRETPADHYPELSTTQRWGRFTRIEPLQETTELAGDVFAFWGEVTGQEQGWNMFTPDFPPHTVVPIAELRWADGSTARVASRFNPRDPEHPQSRWPLIHDREFNYEANITMIGWHATPEAVAAKPDVWGKLPQRVRENNTLVLRWLVWKSHTYMTANPGTPEPVEVILVFQYIPTPLPNDAPNAPRKPAFERPFARWFPSGPRAPGLLPLEGFNPVTRQFVPLPAVTQL
jgi:hypothetical protein